MLFETKETKILETVLQSPLDAGPYKDVITDHIPSEQSALFIEVHPQEDCAVSECFDNCKMMVTNHGGSVLYGWAIRVWPRRYIYAEAHAIWLESETEGLDPTPRTNQESEILFLIDSNIERVQVKQCRIPSHIIPLTDDPKILETIRLRRKFEAIQANHGKFISPSAMMDEILPAWKEYADHMKTAAFNIDGDDPCTCFSRVRASRCCYKNNFQRTS